MNKGTMYPVNRALANREATHAASPLRRAHEIAKPDCLTADLMFRLLVANRCEYSCANLIKLRKTAILANLTLDWYKEKTVRGGIRLSIF